MYFGKNLIKQKLQDASDLVGWVTFLGPNPDLEGPGPHALLELWSLLLKGVHKIKFVVCFPKSYLVRLDTFYPGPRVQGGQKGGPKGFWSLSRTFWQTLYNTKIFGHPPQYSGVGHLCGPQIQIWKDLGLVFFWSCGP